MWFPKQECKCSEAEEDSDCLKNDRGRFFHRGLYFVYSKISPGWHSSAAQIASSVDKRTARALPFFKIEMLAMVMPTRSVSSVTLILRFASMTSMLIVIAIALHG